MKYTLNDGTTLYRIPSNTSGCRIPGIGVCSLFMKRVPCTVFLNGNGAPSCHVEKEKDLPNAIYVKKLTSEAKINVIRWRMVGK